MVLRVGRSGEDRLPCFANVYPYCRSYTRGLLSQGQDLGNSFYCLPYISAICIFRFRIKQSAFHNFWIEVGLMMGMTTSPWQTVTQRLLVCMPMLLVHESYILLDATNTSYFPLLYMCVCVWVCIFVCIFWQLLVLKIPMQTHTHTHTSKFYSYKHNLFIQIKFSSKKNMILKWQMNIYLGLLTMRTNHI